MTGMSLVTIGARGARTLVSDLARHPGPKTGLLVGATAGSEVLAAAVDALLPEDTLVVTAADPAGTEALAAPLDSMGGWVGDRVRVIDSVTAADPADVVVLASPVTGSAETVRATVDTLAKLLNPGGVLAAAVAAGPGFAAGSMAELERQSALYGVGTDLVLRNLPPLRVHRLSWSPGDPALAERLLPVSRPSSIPLTPGMHIDSNGLAAAGVALGMAAAARLSRRGSRLWLLPALAAVPVAAFFRDPRRDVPEDPSLVVAASDGKVLSVERVVDDRFSVDGGAVDYLRIAVFLSILDPHINRAPAGGRVVDYFLADGGYAPAMTPDSEHNAAAYTVLETARGRVVVAQRTGLVARRIVQRAPVGAMLARGERFGLIRFGSRTDVYLPAGAAEPLVAPADRVRAGATPLARWL